MFGKKQRGRSLSSLLGLGLYLGKRFASVLQDRLTRARDARRDDTEYIIASPSKYLNILDYRGSCEPHSDGHCE